MRTNQHFVRSIRLVAGLLAAITLAAGLRAAEDPYGIASWPDEPEWRSLTNHLDQCYRAVWDRCIAAKYSAPSPPSLVNPRQDYVHLAAMIDSICRYYVNHTYADDKGRFDGWLAEHPVTNSEAYYPNTVPLWTPEALHAFCGFSNWATNGLTSWAVCDRSIQAQVVAALKALRMTKVWATPADSAEHWYWASWQGGEPHEFHHEETWAMWPYAFSETGYEQTDLIGFAPDYDIWVSDGDNMVLEPNDYLLLDGETNLPAGWKSWWYRAILDATILVNDYPWGYAPAEVTIDGGTTLQGAPFDPFWMEWGASTQFQCRVVVRAGDNVRQMGHEGSFIGCSDGTGEFTGRYIDVRLNSVNSAQPLVISERVSNSITLDSCPTNHPASRSLYVWGGIPPFRRTNPSVDACQWAPEVGDLQTNCFTFVWQEGARIAESSECTTFALSGTRPYGGAALALQKGWAVTHNARLPSGLERAADENLFRWGGYTSGGKPEIVIDRIIDGTFSISEWP